MFFTDREKAAIFRLMGSIACADGNLAYEEKKLTDVVVSVMNGPGKGADLALNMKPSEAMDIVAAMTYDEKRFVCSALGSMVAIDGRIDDKEMLLWALFSERCKLPEMSLGDAIKQFKEYLR